MAESKTIGFVATGDELMNGDILNTNCQRFCQLLIEHGMTPGQQVVVGDNQADITAAIEYLRPKHHAIITIGGLGPTSDDVTRQSLAEALQLPLVYHSQAWDWIVDKLSSLGYAQVPETNRQQAYFPQGASALHNLNGTAAGCHVIHQQRDFFMLPGPPNECMPLFQQHVLPYLTQAGYASQLQRKSWLLLGVSEGEMAATLQPIASHFPDVTLGFRVSYPYLEIKLVSSNTTALEQLSQRFLAEFAEQVVSTQQQTATQQLRAWLAKHPYRLKIEDTATYGALLQHLLCPATADRLIGFEDALPVRLSGLSRYWQTSAEATDDKLQIQLGAGEQQVNAELTVPLRGERTLISASERAAWWLLRHLKSYGLTD